MITWLPSYLNQILHYNVKKSGIVSVLPFLAKFFFCYFSGWLGDLMISKWNFRIATVRKMVLEPTTNNMPSSLVLGTMDIFLFAIMYLHMGCCSFCDPPPPPPPLLQAMACSELVPAAALIAIGYLSISDPMPIVALLTVAVGFSGFGSAGYGASFLDVSPQFSGILMSFSNTFATIPGIVAPIAIGDIVAKPHDDVGHWRLVFLIAAGIYGRSFFFFKRIYINLWFQNPFSIHNTL
jgi:hypothetical protein